MDESAQLQVQPTEISPPITCTQETMLQIQSPTFPLPTGRGHCGLAAPPSQHYHPIAGHWAFANFLPTSYIHKPVAQSPQPSEDTDGANALEEHSDELMKLFYRMGKPMDLPQRKPVSDVLSEYINQLSKKKVAVLALAAVQVECEESEAVLLEAYGLKHLEGVHQDFYDAGDPKSATGKYFSAVSDIRFDPLGE